MERFKAVQLEIMQSTHNKVLVGKGHPLAGNILGHKMEVIQGWVAQPRKASSVSSVSSVSSLKTARHSKGAPHRGTKTISSRKSKQLLCCFRGLFRLQVAKASIVPTCQTETPKAIRNLETEI